MPPVEWHDRPGGLLNAPGDIRNTNPLLGPLQDNGGPTMTHALLFHSLAIGAGDPNFIRTLSIHRCSTISATVPAFRASSTVASILARSNPAIPNNGLNPTGDS